jgi:AcrR family transcriptional regulator
MPRIVDHDAWRATVAAAALRVLADEGYAGAGMRRIASEAGVSAAALYHYFPDKAAIVHHAFDVMMARHDGLVRADVMDGATPEQRAEVVSAFVRAHQAALLDLIRVGLDVHRYEPALRPLVASAMARYRTVAAEVLGVSPDGEGHAAVACLLGAVVGELLDPGDLLGDSEPARRAWVELLTAGVRRGR